MKITYHNPHDKEFLDNITPQLNLNVSIEQVKSLEEIRLNTKPGTGFGDPDHVFIDLGKHVFGFILSDEFIKGIAINAVWESLKQIYQYSKEKYNKNKVAQSLVIVTDEKDKHGQKASIYFVLKNDLDREQLESAIAQIPDIRLKTLELSKKIEFSDSPEFRYYFFRGAWFLQKNISSKIDMTTDPEIAEWIDKTLLKKVTLKISPIKTVLQSNEIYLKLLEVIFLGLTLYFAVQIGNKQNYISEVLLKSNFEPNVAMELDHDRIILYNYGKSPIYFNTLRIPNQKVFLSIGEKVFPGKFIDITDELKLYHADYVEDKEFPIIIMEIYSSISASIGQNNYLAYAPVFVEIKDAKIVKIRDADTIDFRPVNETFFDYYQTIMQATSTQGN